MSDTKVEAVVGKCGMWPKKMNLDCGNPATLGWQSEVSGIIPICDDCIRETGTERKNLRPLPSFKGKE